MKALGRDIKMFIFDLDGTLLDSTSVWAKVDSDFFSRNGKEVPPTYGHEISTMGLSKAAEYTRDTYFPHLTSKEILETWDYLSQKEYEENIPLKEGAVSLLDYLREQGIILTVATANSPHLYMPALERLGISSFFSAFMDPSKCNASKSSTKFFDELAASFKLEKEEVAVVEDSLLPLTISKEAGYLSIGVFDKRSTKNIQLFKEKSDIFMNSLSDLLALLKKENL